MSGRAAVAVGVDVGGTKLVAATVDAAGRPLERRRRTTPARDADQLVVSLQELADELGPDLPLGIGIAGLVTPDGTVRYGPNIGVRELPLATVLRRDGGEVAVVNDASAAALGEQRVGAGRGLDDVVLLTLGTGVGGGLVVGGQLRLGANGFAAELGHVTVADGGRRCPCGDLGCIEAYASGTALGLAARERLVDPDLDTTLRAAQALDGRAVTDAAVAGDAVARELLGDVGRWLAVAVGSLVNALDPELVLVGGGAAPASAPWVLPACREALPRHVIGAAHRDLPPIELTALGDDAGMIGAALLAAERAGTLDPRPTRDPERT